jgi:hypothetical protein
MNLKLALLIPSTLALLHFACGSVADPSCPAATRLEGGVCVSNAVAASCGPGTRNEAGVCLPTPPGGVVCPGGTSLVAGQCVAADGGGVSCGPGTALVGGQCTVVATDAGSPKDSGAPDSAVSDASDGGAAGAQDTYDLRVGATQVAGNGFSRVPVFVIGRRGDGSPLTEKIILGVNRVGSGTLQPFQLSLESFGSNSEFVPCNTSFSAACVGKTRVTMAKASAPDVILAQSPEIEITLPKPVWSADECRNEPNIIHLDGLAGDYIHPGIETIRDGVFAYVVESNSTSGTDLRFEYDRMTRGERWTFWFTTTGLGQPMDVQVYENAARAPIWMQVRPGLSVSGAGRGCNTLAGAYQVHSLTRSGGQVSEMLVSFEQKCDERSPALRGCMHFTR